MGILRHTHTHTQTQAIIIIIIFITEKNLPTLKPGRFFKVTQVNRHFISFCAVVVVAVDVCALSRKHLSISNRLGSIILAAAETALPF